MTLHKKAPPGFMTLDETFKSLGMSRANFYNSGLVDYPDSWQSAPNTPRLYRIADVSMLRYWLFVRKGLVALGKLGPKHPLKPRFEGMDNLHYFHDQGDYNCDCPKCGGAAITLNLQNPQDKRAWCPECGILELEIGQGDHHD